jgi:DNA repair protein RadC
VYTPIYRVELVREGRQTIRDRSISGPEDAAAIFRRLIGDRDREVFVVAGLSVKNEVIGLSIVSIGTLDAALVYPRDVFKPALLMNAYAVIIAHHHPSGGPELSEEDRRVTDRLIEAGRILGIEVYDHLILGDGAHVSLRQLGTFRTATHDRHT